jgi:hypothetical protein
MPLMGHFFCPYALYPVTVYTFVTKQIFLKGNFTCQLHVLLRYYNNELIPYSLSANKKFHLIFI